jgi:SAM-dependent methyltransferase
MADSTDPARSQEYFTGLAGLYAAHRPGYPAPALELVLAGLRPPVEAADVGCGTGISARLLAERGARVIGIDPNADMLASARLASRGLQGLEFRRGSGEGTGLPAASLDLVLCAQSFHWLEARAALAEFRRILRPGGRLALVWNVVERSDPFSAEYRRVAERAQADAAGRGLCVPRERAADHELRDFTALRRSSFPNPQELDLEGLLGRMRSASYFPRCEPLRGELEHELATAFERHARGGRVALLHRTEVTLAERR